MDTITSETVTKRHPVRGFFWGIPFGLGLMLIAVGQGWAALGTWPPFIVFLIGVIVATLWATLGPAKAPKGPPPSGATLADEPTPEPETIPEPEPTPEAAAAESEMTEAAPPDTTAPPYPEGDEPRA